MNRLYRGRGGKSNADIYIELGECLSKMPQGFPSTKSQVEIKILKKLFTPEEALVFKSIWGFFRPVRAKSSDKSLQKKLNMSEKELGEKLDQMAKNGLLLEQCYDSSPGDHFYMTPPFLIGLYEFSLKRMDRELAELYHEYMDEYALWVNKIPTKQLRVVPVSGAIDPSKVILPYDEINHIIKDHYSIAVAPCVCAAENQAKGSTCTAPIERCITFDWLAEHYIYTGLGRKVSETELNGILKMSDEKGLVVSASNMKNSLGMCLCCSCCCTALKIMKMSPFYARDSNASYLAEIDPGQCSQCGKCLHRCQMGAIDLNQIFSVSRDKCIGCGLCVTTCPEGAVKIIRSGRYPNLPNDVSDLFLKMYEEHIKMRSYGNSFIKNNMYLLVVKILQFYYKKSLNFNR